MAARTLTISRLLKRAYTRLRSSTSSGIQLPPSSPATIRPGAPRIALLAMAGGPHSGRQLSSTQSTHAAGACHKVIIITIFSNGSAPLPPSRPSGHPGPNGNVLVIHHPPRIRCDDGWRRQRGSSGGLPPGEYACVPYFSSLQESAERPRGASSRTPRAIRTGVGGCSERSISSAQSAEEGCSVPPHAADEHLETVDRRVSARFRYANVR